MEEADVMGSREKELYSPGVFGKVRAALGRPLSAALLASQLFLGAPAAGKTVKQEHTHRVVSKGQVHEFPVVMEITGPDVVDPRKRMVYTIDLKSPRSPFDYTAVVFGVEKDSGRVLDDGAVYLDRGQWVRQDPMSREEYRERWEYLGNVFGFVEGMGPGGGLSDMSAGFIARLRDWILGGDKKEAESNIPGWAQSGNYSSTGSFIAPSGRFGSNYTGIRWEVPMVADKDGTIKVRTISNIFASHEPVILDHDFYVGVSGKQITPIQEPVQIGNVEDIRIVKTTKIKHTQGGSIPPAIVWDPSGTKIIYDDGGTLMLYDIMENRKTLLLNDQRIMPNDSVFSPDGTKIIFRNDRTRKVAAELWIMDVNGEYKRLPQADIWRRRLYDWSPSGNYVAYADDRGNLHKIDITTEDDVVIYDGVHGDALDWFPNDRIVFVGDDGNIHIIDAMGRDEKTLTIAEVPAGSPKWSRNGEYITYDVMRTRDQWIIDRNGGNNRLVVKSRYSDLSPDNRYIVTAMDKGTKADIYIVDVFTGEKRNLTNTYATDELGPMWSPKGDKIAYFVHADFYKNNLIHVLDVDGAKGAKISQMDGR